MLSAKRSAPAKGPLWRISDGFLLYDDHVIVPSPQALLSTVLPLMHMADPEGVQMTL